MLSNAHEALEFPRLIALLRRFVASPLGEAQLEAFALRPSFASPGEAAESLEEVAEAMDWLRYAAGAKPGGREARPPNFRGLEDVRTTAAKLRIEGVSLEAPRLYALLEALDRSQQIRAVLLAQGEQRPRLARYGEQLEDFGPLLKELGGKILPGGELADDASPALARIRRQIEQQRQAVHRSLEQFVRKHNREGVLQDDYVTIRNGRLVVPVKTTWKWRVEGVIHNTSSSGNTVFVEPLETIEINNQLVGLLEEEQRETLRILREMTDRLAWEAEAAIGAIETIGELEWIFAKAQFGCEFHAGIPSFSTGSPTRLTVSRARHPLLEDVLREKKQEVVDLSLQLDGAQPGVIISGPNAGGKTVALKTVGLLALMAQGGLPIPAAEAEFPWFERVLADIGDAQSIEENLSTFSAHVRRLRAMMECANDRSLVLIDELGAATDPEEGSALGAEIIRHFLEQGAFTLVSTHLPGLKAMAAHEPRVRNAAVGFDETSLAPNYKLRVGLPGQSAGLALAERFGIPAALVGRARAGLGQEQQQAAILLQRLHEQVQRTEQAEKELRAAEREMRERERRLERYFEKREQEKLDALLEEFQELTDKLRSEHEAEIERLRQAQASRRVQVEAQRRAAKMRREREQRFRETTDRVLGRERPPSKSEAAPLSLREGIKVRLGEMGATGRIVRKLSGNRWEVRVGNLKMQTSEADITEVIAEPQQKISAADSLPGGVRLRAAARATRPTEINVIGRSPDEARSEVDKFLDDAVLADVDRVRVVHGHGMQVLRKALWQMFASHPQVERYYQAEQNEGGAGATIVDVKRD